jgi:hypothetical protein
VDTTARESVYYASHIVCSHAEVEHSAESRRKDNWDMAAVTRSGDGWSMTWLPSGMVMRYNTNSKKTKNMGRAATEVEFDTIVREYVAVRERSTKRQPCPSRKYTFWTEEEAITALANALLSGSERRREQRRYDCTEGGTVLHWHLTSMSVWVG